MDEEQRSTALFLQFAGRPEDNNCPGFKIALVRACERIVELEVKLQAERVTAIARAEPARTDDGWKKRPIEDALRTELDFRCSMNTVLKTALEVLHEKTCKLDAKNEQLIARVADLNKTMETIEIENTRLHRELDRYHLREAFNEKGM